MRWNVVQTKANADRVAENALTAADLDYTVYFPKVKVEVRHAGRREMVIRPFLPRYGFVLDEGKSLHYVKTAQGVSHVLLQGDGPAYVRQDVIDAIKSREHKGFVQLLVDDPSFDQFVPGRPIKVKSGSFEGMEGVFLERDGRRRAMLFLGSFRVSVDASDIEVSRG